MHHIEQKEKTHWIKQAAIIAGFLMAGFGAHTYGNVNANLEKHKSNVQLETRSFEELDKNRKNMDFYEIMAHMKVLVKSENREKAIKIAHTIYIEKFYSQTKYKEKAQKVYKRYDSSYNFNSELNDTQMAQILTLALKDLDKKTLNPKGQELIEQCLGRDIICKSITEQATRKEIFTLETPMFETAKYNLTHLKEFDVQLVNFLDKPTIFSPGETLRYKKAGEAVSEIYEERARK